jgi:hypothetical protein
MLGHAFGSRGLWIGGIVGGLVAAVIAARVAVWRGWVARRQYWRTAAGAGIGFLAAALVAARTLSSPIGPVLSTALIGIGAVVGGWPSSEASSSERVA